MHPRTQPPLFFLEDDDEDRPLINAKSRLSVSSRNLFSVSRTSSNSADFSNINDILQFPIENSHAYSYAHLSPNSLALRLNVLKRSLEILKERPDWFKSMNHKTKNNEDDGPARHTEVDPTRRKAPLKHFYKNPLSKSGDNLSSSEKYKLRPNASSAALAALFRPKIPRSDSLPVSRQSPEPMVKENVVAELSEDLQSPNDSILNDDLKDIIDLLENNTSMVSNHSEIASTLHDLSLSSSVHEKKQNMLKSKLLFALATPFVESSTMTSSLLGTSAPTMGGSVSAGAASATSLGNSPLPSASTATLNMLQNVPQPSTAPGNRPFHAISLGKHASPQSVFTVDVDSPWSLKAANDLACLMFGVLKNMIRNLTLMDLIAPQFRTFVMERLTRVVPSSLDKTGKTNILFAGEIIAISRQADGKFAWTSMWAKKRGNLIICMFEQTPCDAFDIVALVDVATYPEEPYAITSVTEMAGRLITEQDASKITQLSAFSDSLASELRALSKSHPKDFDSCDIEDSEEINRTRYYTAQLNGDDNIPCAVTSYPLEMNDDKYEIKLKVHSMPYIAGMFVVNFSNYEILSCNKAIAKNLFGKSSDELVDQRVDCIIPHFSEILNSGLRDQDEPINIVPGLVLPEHFFRKYHAALKYDKHSNISAEELFFSSKGIDGLHRDGKALFIDVQLRVVLYDVFVLWVTYSRHTNKNITKDLNRLSKSASSISPFGSGTLLHKPHGRSSPQRSKVDLPSQLSLFPENESEILELGSSSAEISRKSSVRRPNKANTFSIPVSYLNGGFGLTASGQKTPSQRTASNQSTTDSQVSEETPETSASSPETSISSASGQNTYHKFSEEEILKIENDALAEKAKKSKFWPTVIGAKKRTKKYDEFKVVKKMGEGAYGKVVLAQHKEDPAYKIIIKCIDKQRILVDTWVRDRQLGTIPSEIQVMATLNHEPHPNIMRIIDYFEDPNYYYLETPIFGDPPAIDLFDYIEVRKDMSEAECQSIFKQIVSSIYHLHKSGIVHRDIKDENIIVDEHGIIKLIDFGSASYVKLGPFDVFVGTIDYASPEVLRGEKYEGKAQDIWALGILLYTMIYKENPFYNVDEIMEGDLRVPYVVSEASLKLIRKILVREVSGRPSITDIAEDEWLDV